MVTADLQLALKLADIADEITSARYLAQDLEIITKPDNTPVTDADRATEKALREVLQIERPADGLLGEEFGNNVEGIIGNDVTGITVSAAKSDISNKAPSVINNPSQSAK